MVARAESRHPYLAFAARPATVDLRTAGVLGLEWAVLALAYGGSVAGWLPFWATFLLGVVAMNFAFTVWHEAIHQTVSSNRKLNDLIGRLGAVPVFIFYDRLTAHHLLHHKFTNEPGRDPDHWQIRGPFWSLIFRYFAGEKESRALCYAADPERGWSRRDHLQILASLAVLLAMLLATPAACFWAIILPRLALCYVHPFYVNYLPHVGLPPGRYASVRMLETSPLISWMMLHHNFHVLHHAYPAIPWHRYRPAYELLGDDLAARGVTSMRLAQSWRLLWPPRGDDA